MVVIYVTLAVIWSITLSLVAAYAIRSHLLARHIRAHHPILWKTLREPDLLTGQGNRRDPLGRWLSKGKYREMHDPYLRRWCPHVQRLALYATNSFLSAIVLTLAGVVTVEFLLK